VGGRCGVGSNSTGAIQQVVVAFNLAPYGGSANVHVWIGSIQGRRAGTVTAGKFRIVRVGSTLSGYLDSTLIYSRSSTSALTAATFLLQLQPGSDDPTAATFDNFHFTATCP
jgi:hypothetical protein